MENKPNYSEDEGFDSEKADRELEDSNIESGQVNPDPRNVGARILALSGFEGRHGDAAGNALDYAQKTGEKPQLIGGEKPLKNNERRDWAYIKRFEDGIVRRGNHFEKRLWQESARRLVIEPDDIPESYWQSQEQILRDNGHGDMHLGQFEKQQLTESIQQQQRESVDSWANYLGDKNSPYPIWFKIYAFDGMSKMGVFEKNKGKFGKRDKTTVAPYPHLNPAVLAKVYGTIAAFYGISDQERYDDQEDSKGSQELEQLIRSGNFNNLYSKLLLEQKSIPEIPKNPEDVHGTWIEYRPGEEQELSFAAEGTPWCIADPGVGRNYLRYGEYGEALEQEEDDPYFGYEAQEQEEDDSDNKAKFILLHLNNPSTNLPADTACASIRLGPDGNVAEISGLQDGQALDDVLVPVVQEKVKSLPGGEKFLQAFADKQELIQLDRKWQANEPFTQEEWDFVFEVNRKIVTLDTYRDEDPRLREFRDVDAALNHGADANQLVEILEPRDIADHLDTLLAHGAHIDVNQLVARLKSDDISEYLGVLLDHGADLNQLVARLDSYDIAENLNILLDHGADVDQLVARLEPRYIAENLGTLLDHGAHIDVDQLVARLEPHHIAENLGTLLDHGAHIDVDQLVARLEPRYIVDNLDTLFDHGAHIDVDQLAVRLKPIEIVVYLDILLDHGADADQLVARLEPYDIADHLDILLDHGADVNQLVARLEPYDIAENLNILLDYGANADQLVARIEPYGIADHLDILLDHGADVDRLVARLEPHYIAENLGTLLDHGAHIDVDQLVARLEPIEIVEYLDTLLAHGADVDRLVARLEPDDVSEYLDILLDHGAHISMEQLGFR